MNTQIKYGGIGAGALGVAALIFGCLNSANQRGKKAADGHKRRRPLDPDAPLEYEPPPVE